LRLKKLKIFLQENFF